MFEFRISFFAPIYLGVRISVFEFDLWRIIYRVSEFRISFFGQLRFRSFSKRPFTTQNMESEMAMDLCIDEKDEERESEAQSDVRAKKRARGEGWEGGRGGWEGARFFALTSD